MTEKDKKYIDKINASLPRGAGKFSVINDIIYVTAPHKDYEKPPRRSTKKPFNTANKIWIKNQKPVDLLKKILGDEGDYDSATNIASFGQMVINDRVKEAGNLEYKKEIQRVFNLYIIPDFGNLDITQVDISLLKAFLKDLTRPAIMKRKQDNMPLTAKEREPISNSRIKFIKNVFSNIFEYAIDRELITHNPMKSASVQKMKLDTTPKKKREAYTDEEVKKIIETANGWFKVFIDMLFKTGARTGEVMALKWSDIDLEQGSVFFQRTIHKGTVYEKDDDSGTKNHYRQVFLMSSTLELLRQYHTIRPNLEWVFVSRYNEPYAEPKNIVNNFFKPLLERIGVKYKTIYATRATYISLMLHNGFSLEDIQTNVGHRLGSAVTEKNYLDKNLVNVERRKSVTKKMEDSFIKTSKKDGQIIDTNDPLGNMTDEEVDTLFQLLLSKLSRKKSQN